MEPVDMSVLNASYVNTLIAKAADAFTAEDAAYWAKAAHDAACAIAILKNTE